MTIYKAYKFRMYPNNEQEKVLNSFLGSSRFIFNYYLKLKDKLYKENSINYKLTDMKKDLVPLQTTYPWLKEVDGCILRTTLEDLDKAFDNFYSKRASYPKYKKYGKNESYRTVCIKGNYKGKEYQSIKVDLKNKKIKLPKIKKEIRIRGYRNLKDFNSYILNATITKEAGRYYVSVCACEEVIDKEVIPTRIVGIDLGVKNLVTTSNGEKNGKITIDKEEKRIKKLQRELNRKQKGSNNRKKIINKLQRVHQKIRNKRKYLIHKITKNITLENDIIVAETLKVKEMIENNASKLSKFIASSSLSEIIRQLKYKCKWKGKKFYQIDCYYASSQICNRCGYKESKVKDLSIRFWECKRCSNENDRDINASLNIMYKGLERYIKEYNF